MHSLVNVSQNPYCEYAGAGGGSTPAGPVHGIIPGGCIGEQTPFPSAHTRFLYSIH